MRQEDLPLAPDVLEALLGGDCLARVVGRAGVVVTAVHQVIGERSVHLFEARREQVAFQEDDVIRIDLADGADNPAVDAVESIPIAAVIFVGVEATSRGVADRLVHDVVTGDGGVALVAPGELLPEGDEAVLEVRVLPEVGVAAGVVAVPVRVLPALHRVQVEDGVEVVFRTRLDGAVEALEAGFEVCERLSVAFEVAVVQGQAHGVSAGR